MIDEPTSLIEQLEKVQAALIAAQGRVIWADGPPPDGAEGEWLVELLGRYRHVGRWRRDAWETPVGHAHAESITRHARLE